MYKFQFTCEVICANGKLERIKHHKFFSCYDLLHHWLKAWSNHPGPNGGTYQYFESMEDLQFNADAVRIPKNYPFKWRDECRYGTSSHQTMFYEDYITGWVHYGQSVGRRAS